MSLRCIATQSGGGSGAACDVGAAGRSLEAAPAYAVNISQALRSLARQLDVQEAQAGQRLELDTPVQAV